MTTNSHIEHLAILLRNLYDVKFSCIIDCFPFDINARIFLTNDKF